MHIIASTRWHQNLSLIAWKSAVSPNSTLHKVKSAAIFFFIGRMHSMRKRPWYVKVSVTDTAKFSKSCKEVSNLPHAHVQWTVACDVNINNAKGLIFFKQNYRAWYCIQQWHNCWKCWNNYPCTFTIQESVPSESATEGFMFWPCVRQMLYEFCTQSEVSLREANSVNIPSKPTTVKWF
jgi:hypothetical protein